MSLLKLGDEFTDAQLAALAKNFEGVTIVNPASPAYMGMKLVISRLPEGHLKRVEGAGINILSRLAREELMSRAGSL